MFLGLSKNFMLKWCYIDVFGKVVIRGPFDQVSDFKDGLAWVGVEGGYRIIDINGCFMSDKTYETPPSFVGGVALMKCKNLFGFIDLSGNWVVDPIYHDGGHMHCGLARVRKGSKVFFMDKNGQIKLQMNVSRVGDFSCGYVVAEFPEGVYFLNLLGEKAFGPYDFAEDFEGGVAYVEIGGDVGFISGNGNFTSFKQFDWIAPFCYKDRIKFKKGEKCGFLNPNREIVIEPSYDEVGGFLYDEFAMFSKAGRRGAIHTSGKIAFECIMRCFGDCSEGFIAFSENGKLFGYYDLSGRISIGPRFAAAEKFKNGLAAVAMQM